MQRVQGTRPGSTRICIVDTAGRTLLDGSAMTLQVITRSFISWNCTDDIFTAKGFEKPSCPLPYILRMRSSLAN